jgi:hypothetical protein
MPLRMAGGNWPLRVAGAFRQKPFYSVYITAHGGHVSPETVRQVSGTFLRAGATPCTRNEPLWLTKLVAHATAAIKQPCSVGHSALCRYFVHLFVCSFGSQFSVLGSWFSVPLTPAL